MASFESHYHTLNPPQLVPGWGWGGGGGWGGLISMHLHKVLEKLRPLEQRMRYQLDKLLRAAAAGAPGGTPNPSFFTPKSPRPILPQNGPISPQNATFLTQNGPILPQNTHFCPKMVPFLPQNAPFCPKMALFCLKMPYSPSAWHLFAPKREL